jgi:hypothetical protein
MFGHFAQWGWQKGKFLILQLPCLALGLKDTAVNLAILSMHQVVFILHFA